MPYHGPADITVSARFPGVTDNALENPGMMVYLLAVSSGITQVTFGERLNVPLDANWLTVTRPNGVVLSGEIMQGELSEVDKGGWITFKASVGSLGNG